MIKFGFNAPKSIQAASYLLTQNGGDMDKYMFIKMLYYADREALARWGEPITGDRPVSMKFGPVLSIIYDLTKGTCPLYHSEWSKFISDADQQANRIELVSNAGLDELSRAEVDILKRTFDKFKDWSFGKLRDFFHALDEYDKDVGNGSRPIAIENILHALGKDSAQIKDIAECNG